MPLGQFWADQFCSDPVFRLTKTTRPYFLQSCTLVVSCRRLPEPPPGATAAQFKDLQKVFQEVERALHLGTKASRELQTEINEAFKTADERLRKYIARYNVTLTPGPDTEEVKGQDIQAWDEVSRKDRIAGNWIKKIKELAGAKLESIKNIANLTLNISLWPEKPRKRVNGEWLCDSSNLDVMIDNSASLNVLLHRLLWEKAMRKGLTSFSLKQNPQFYPKFPNKKADFPTSSRGSKSRPDVTPSIPALYVWDPVERYKGSTLHLIIDRDKAGREVELEALTKPVKLPENYGNGWYLDGDKDLIAVRQKGGMHNLLIWNVKQTPTPSIDDSSTSTLVVVPGLTPGMSKEELDQESAEPRIPQMPQVRLPIHYEPAVHVNSRHTTSHQDSGQDMGSAFPRQPPFMKDRPSPLADSNVQRANTSSLNTGQALTASPASNLSKATSPTPTTHSWISRTPTSSSTQQDTPRSIQTRKLLSDSTSTSALSPIPADIYKPNPSQVSDTFNPTSKPSTRPGLSPAPSSLQIPTVPSYNAPKQAEVSVPVKPASAKSSASIIQNDPDERLNQPAPNPQPSSSSPLPPASQSPAPQSAPKRRGAVVVKQTAPPASFDPHFASTSGAMQMVDTEPPAKKKGVRKWLEKFL